MCVMMAGFLSLEPSTAKSFVTRWKPQFVLNQLISTTSINSFTKAMIHLGDARCKCFLLSPSHVGYVVLTKDEKDYVSCILWTQEEKDVEELRSLKEWYAYTTGKNLDGSLLIDSIERELWSLTDFEP